ncbi:hypothetical protein TBLA_0C01900 [Henningerozyma blattae CBS 6284]|uniref:DNA repair and recombination protein RAD52 n=1 Tax=Henningerozyma blattae (strain ATCC 34711 / CBS 6284 / DSM 70876 / NBRC 10599 / NRRL Y-10934 / UCD 77-7) TaxID=1071380 RepID=I2H0V1_HENB6|nr:hypothetical protein TBLA_0C01900 [Tetrapisispora blattae CBS 6284]CCH60003.1 hypothetical protein TBLA_0C01900 [Tetrapisispora blattae CBS 6284]
MEEKKPFITFDEDIQTKLDKKLGPEYISKRVGYGTSRVAYIEGWRAINLANQIFGYSGWSTEVKTVTIDFLDERQGRFSIGCTAIVRVTLANGTYREDIGYGIVDNEKKAAAFERAKKSAVTDALKRALRAFGNALGNCLYDKDFLARIDKVKFDPPDFDEGNLFRPSDEISEISRSNTVEQMNDLNGPPLKKRQLTKVEPVSRPSPLQNNSGINKPADQFTKPTIMNSTTNPHQKPQTNSPQNNNSKSIPQQIPANSVSSKQNIPSNLPTKTEPLTKQEHEDLLDDSLIFSDDFQDDDLINMGGKPSSPPQNSTNQSLGNLVNSALIQDDPVAFVTAKAAPTIQNGKTSNISKDILFDPKFKAQSIKHTLDQTTSTPVPHSILKENGIDKNVRSDSYERYASKGKQLSDDVDNTSSAQNNLSTETVKSNSLSIPNNNTHPSQSPQTPSRTTMTTAPQYNSINQFQKPNNSSRFAPSAAPIHPNTQSKPLNNFPIKPMRREVGRPKILPSNFRKPDNNNGP